MENQIGKLTKMSTESPPGNLSGNTKNKSNEDAKVVTLRSGKELVKISSMVVEEEKGTVPTQEGSTSPKDKEVQ